jgi:micrococcal nuclease
MYTYKVKDVLSVIDGDTVDIIISIGFDIYLKQRIRLAGINAPETRTLNEEEKKRGLASKEWLKKKLLGAELIIKTIKEEKYGRMLGHIYVNGSKTSVNEEMISLGLAVPYMVDSL